MYNYEEASRRQSSISSTIQITPASKRTIITIQTQIPRHLLDQTFLTSFTSIIHLVNPIVKMKTSNLLSLIAFGTLATAITGTPPDLRDTA
jgi:hypothetical protein